MLRVRNEQERWMVIALVTLVSVSLSLGVTSLASDTALSLDAIIPAVTVPLLVAPPVTYWSCGRLLEIHRLNLRLR